MTVYEARKNVYGVPEINTRFLRKIQEITFQQMKALCSGGPNED